MTTRIAWLVVLSVGLVGGWSVGAAADEKPTEAQVNETKAAETSGESPADRKAADEYYEILSLLVDTIDQVERNYVQKLSRRELVEAAIQGILHKLDPYSNYIAPEDITRFRTSVENQFGGIGIQITDENGGLEVLTPLVGSPAYRAGMQAGDRIVEIEGESTDGIDTNDAVQKLKGEIGTEVTIKIKGPDDKEPRPLTLKREMVHLETVLGDLRKGDDHWDFMLDPDQKIGYVRLSSFSRDTADELRKALGELKDQGLRGLVFDLRFNPGGLLTSAVDVSDLFLAKGKIVSTAGRNIEEKSWDAKAGQDFEDFPMAILVNRYSASSSEIVAACLQDHKRAVVIGERTWGKGSVQNVVEMEGGKSALKLTTASYMRPSGKNIHRFPDAQEKDEWGVMPDDGYSIRFSDDELRTFLSRRRERDFVHRKNQATTVVAANDAEAAAPEAADAEKPAEAEPAPAETKAEDEAAKSEPKVPVAEEKAEPADSPAADENEKPDEAKDGDDAAADEKETDKEDSKKESDEKDDSFVDRQLQKALEYIKSKLTEKKEAA